MPGLFEIMNTGARGLFSSQLALNITSQNISNANTEGYSRKRLNLEADYRRDPSFGQMGFGVEVTNITRLRDFFLDRQINRQTNEMSYFSEMNDTLVRIENVISEPSDNALSTVLEKFWDSWADLGNNPQSMAAREVVKANAQVLIGTFHNLSGEIRNMSEAKNDDLVATVNQINGYLSDIYSLNREISIVEVSGKVKANDSRDQRDLLIKKLSELINVTTEEGPNGMVSVLTNGNMLVAPSNFVTLETATVVNKRPDGTEFSTVGIRLSSTKETYMPVSGKLRGIIDSRDMILPYYEGKLDELANSIVNSVNQQHELGYTLNGTTGIDFFKVNNHEEMVAAHKVIVTDRNFAFNSTTLPSTFNLGTPNIEPGSSFVLKDDTGLVLTPGVDYSVNNATGVITLLASPTMTGYPAPPATPSLLASYNYTVPRGPQTVFKTYASNIELSAAIEKSVGNIAAASGTTTRAFTDRLQFGALGSYFYIHHSTGPDGAYNTADDVGADGLYGTQDDLRERVTIKEGTFTIRSGATILKENQDFVVDYANGQVIMLNPAYVGVPLDIDYEAAVPGSNGLTDNANAVAISELRHTKVMAADYAGNPTSTINTFYNSFVSELGVQRNEFESNSDSRKFLVEQFEARQAEIAGVSLDEELANLVKYQHTYQASARVIATVDKMLEVLFTM